MIVLAPPRHQRGMSDETSPSTITEALERAASVHAEALRQIEELLRDETAEDSDDTLAACLTGRAPRLPLRDTQLDVDSALREA